MQAYAVANDLRREQVIIYLLHEYHRHYCPYRSHISASEQGHSHRHNSAYPRSYKRYQIADTGYHADYAEIIYTGYPERYDRKRRNDARLKQLPAKELLKCPAENIYAIKYFQTDLRPSRTGQINFLHPLSQVLVIHRKIYTDDKAYDPYNE